MYHHQHTGTTGSHPKRRKKRPIHGIKSVEVTRGRSGYGFTISGQHPCVLSVIVPGSPAEIAGLKTGDYLVSVNNENVTKAAHDDVVRMVGMSTGTLSLQVAENYNSSDSSDDEYQHRTKARYPNRVRSRHATGSTRHNDKVLGECNQRDRHQSSSEYKHKDPYSARQDIPSKSGTSRSRLNAPVGAENSLPEVNSGQKVSQLSAPLSMERKGPLQPNSVFSTPAMHHPLAKQAVVKSTTQSARSARPGAVGIQGNLEVNRHNRTDASSSLQNSNVTPGISSFLKTSAHHSHSANNAFIMMEEDEDVDGDDEESLLNCSFHDTRVVVGYIGSIEMPSDANKPHIRLQSIRSAVRRLRIEQKIHTLVLMDVSQDGVKLTNAMGTTVAHYPVDRLAFSGVCPDDKRFFGIVTLHCSNTDDSSEENGSQDEEASSSGSCHVFMVDPEMKAHNIHAQKAKTFGINCTPTQDRHQCSEFPRSATSIIVAITNLYKDRPGGISNDNEVALSQAFADPSRAPQRSASNSSNSDSGLGFGKDDPSHDNVYVVDMPQARDVHQQPPRRAQNSFQAPGEPMQSHLSPGVQTMPAPMQGNQGVLSASCNIKPKPNRSASIDDISFMTPNEKFSIRAMPDSAHSLNMHADVLDKQNSAENLRASMQRLLQARDNHKVDQAPSSDQESNSSKNSDIFRSFSHPELQHSISAPFRQLSDDSSFSNAKKDSSKYEAVDIDNKKLSPRAFLPPFHQLRSPSAPPTVSRRADSDSDGDVDFSLGNASGMGSLIERFEHDHALRISSPANVSRRFSEGFALNTQREKDKVLEDGEKWSKPSTVRHRRLSRLQQPLSHSHESLVQLEHEVSNQRLSSVGSVNNITSHGSDNELKEEDIGRIAGWSVNFFKLLQDNGGLAVFTEFLKKEFSQENIIFWRTVEQYKKIDDSDKRKAKAKEIFTKHMSPKAADPINIEQSNRQLVEKQLDNPSSTTFDKPQLEIFKLMKQDSYPRFLKSELYKVYLMREMEGKPLNLPKDEFEEGQGKSKKEDKKKNKSKETEEKDKEKRRRSLLPWRQRNSKQNLKTTSDSEIKKHKEKEKEKMSTSTSSVSKEVNNNNTQKKSASGPGIDLSTMRKEVQANLKESKDKEVEEKNMKFCRVILPDGSTTVVCTKPGQSIRTVLGRLCEKRGLSIAAVDVFLLGSDKPLDLGEDVSSLGSKEVIIERRVLFRMDLPNRKSIGVKAKPNRTVRDVFKPILNKYGFKLDSITVQLSGQMGYVDIDEQVSTIDNQRIVILPTDGVQAKDGSPSTSKRPPPVVKYPPDFHVNSQTDSTSLDMITNRIFEDLMKGKSSKMAHNFDELGILDPELKTKVQLRGSDEHRSLGLFGLLRKESAYGKPAQDRTKMKTKNKVTFDLQRNETRRTENYPEDDNFFDLLSKVQSDRYEDQRGLGTRASDIPAFLHKKMPHPSGRESAPPIMKQDHSRSESENMFTDIADYVKNDNDKFASYTRGHVSGRPASVPADSVRLAEESSDHIAYENNSFSADGVYPSTEEAENVFQSTAPDSADFDDPCLAEKGLRDIGFDYNYNMYQAKAWGYSRHRPNMSSRSSHSHSGINSPVRGPDRYSFEESSIYQTSEEDQDKTIVNSPVRQARPHSVPPVFGSELNAPISPITPTNSVKSSNSDRVQNNSFNEIGAGVEHSTPKSGQNSTQVRNHKSAFHSPSLKQNSQKESNNKNDKECLNTPDKVMVVHVTDDEESVTFV